MLGGCTAEVSSVILIFVVKKVIKFIYIPAQFSTHLMVSMQTDQ